MGKAKWTPLAIEDLADIAYYIAVEDRRPITADRIIDELSERAEQFASAPHLGHRHPELPESWRYARHKRWLLVFLVEKDDVHVLRVVDASRNLLSLFKEHG